MRTGKLTAIKVAALVRAAKAGYTGDGGGLYLQISKFGTATWAFRYRVGAKLRTAGLGSLDTWSLAEARERALKMRQQRADGIDPIDERRAERARAAVGTAKAMTFRKCAEAYIAAHRVGWRSPKSLSAWEGTLAMYAYPAIGDLPVRDVDTALVMKVLGPAWSRAPETANRLRGRIEAILGWATTSGFRGGENPARWRGHLENLLARPGDAKRAKREAKGRTAHHAALPYAEIAAFMGELRGQDGIGARALEFAVLTAARTGEVIGARWDEFDDPGAPTLWTIPAGRMKGGREHRVPLSAAAAAIVKSMAAIRSGDLLFPGARAGEQMSNMTLLALLKRMKRADLTVHGFRSTFRDWAAERTNFPAEVAEMALAHAVGDKVEAAYRRGDLFAKRRQLGEAWAKFCAAPAVADGRKVVPLRAVGR
jgi:integrase